MKTETDYEREARAVADRMGLVVQAVRRRGWLEARR